MYAIHPSSQPLQLAGSPLNPLPASRKLVFAPCLYITTLVGSAFTVCISVCLPEAMVMKILVFKLVRTDFGFRIGTFFGGGGGVVVVWNDWNSPCIMMPCAWRLPNTSITGLKPVVSDDRSTWGHNLGTYQRLSYIRDSIKREKKELHTCTRFHRLRFERLRFLLPWL